MTRADGRKKVSAASSQSVSDPGPTCAAAASHRIPATAEMLNSTRCHSRSSRRSAGWLSDMVPACFGRSHVSGSSYTKTKGSLWRPPRKC